MQETVLCSNCLKEYTIKETMLCKCGQEIMMSNDIRELIRSLDAQIVALRLEAIRQQSELARRERLRRAKQTGQNDPFRQDVFWQNVHKKPAWASRPKATVISLTAAELAEFD